MSRKWSTARISSSPASGILNIGMVAAMTTRLARGTSGHALGRHHQHQQHRDFLADAEVDPISLRDEDRREGHVHHRAVEIERIAERKDEAGDPRRHSEPVERLERSRIGGFAGSGREGENDGIANVADEMARARSDDHEADADQKRPEDREAEVEAADELAEGAR